MILVTVGTQLPFDRLINSVEQWAVTKNYNDIVFQVGRSGYKPSIGRSVEFIPAPELQSIIEQAELVIAHAGTGTMISCLSQKKPIVIMPRDYLFGEHRNNHQKATVAKLHNIHGVFVADSEHELPKAIDTALLATNHDNNFDFPAYAQDSLIEHIKNFIF